MIHQHYAGVEKSKMQEQQNFATLMITYLQAPTDATTKAWKAARFESVSDVGARRFMGIIGRKMSSKTLEDLLRADQFESAARSTVLSKACSQATMTNAAAGVKVGESEGRWLKNRS